MSFESPDFVLWEWKFAWKKLLGGNYCSIPVKRLFFFPTFRFFVCLNVSFSSEILGFFQQCKEITSLVTRVMLFRDVKNLRWTKRMVGFHVVAIPGRKLKLDQRIFVQHPAAGNSWSQHSLQAYLLPTCSPWDKLPAAALSGHADPLLLATWVQIFLSHRSCLTWCGYNSTRVKQLD